MSQSEQARAAISSLGTKGLVVGVIGLAASAAAYASDPAQFFQSYLTAYLYWMAIALGCLGWTMIHHVTQGPWGIAVKRIWEAGARVMPLMAVFFIPIYLGMDHLFSWSTPEMASDVIVQGKSAYLNTSFFLLRAGLYFVIWSGFAYLLTSLSYKQDGDELQPYFTRMRVISGPGLLVMALTVTLMSVDWAMSIDPHFFSTMFGFLFVASDLLAAMAFTVVVVKMFESYEPINRLLDTQNWHDLGNWLMALVMLWAYLAFSQFLIIWSGNIQEESVWVLDRMGDGWILVSLALIIFHFALPFLTLLTRRTKRAKGLLVKVAIYMLVMRYLDLYWIVQPSFLHGHAPNLAALWVDVAVLLGMGGLFVWRFTVSYRAQSLAPAQDPRLKAILEGGAAGGHH